MKSITLTTLSLCAALFAWPMGTTAEHPPARRQATTQTPFHLAPEDVQVMLKDLKYETAMTAQSQFEIEMKQSGFVFHPFVAVSTSGNKIWVTMDMRPLTAIDLTNAALLSKLLIANSSIGPGQFYIENVADPKKPVAYWLGFGYPIDNRGVTEQVLQDALDSFATDLADQAPLWQAAKN
ncbi:MAG: hypothetical protein ACYC96_08130 [Fimbriimonadaceae bacterium]